ncbi:murein transglycosylase domain-containing protein [Desulfovibrio ferrophilus]|uniref:Lytic transglycosylase catalytic n=1 Tax=Desulfovibrio ferrophilus TaxID=241368 RepID=A0A2Z6AYR1_9BACT|nr:murein transglycosylase domain-containing protein [Desulfovibrio ferrophilus]BBD08305.1 lytic transglycosylase catalytic [Desulfovibrio ferrophilus]
MPNRSSTKILISLALCLLLAACSAGDAVRTVRIIATGDAAGAGVMAAEKATRYVLNPKALSWDLKQFKERLEAFRKAIGGVWGEKERQEPTPKRYVKYTRNYLSRASVNFDTGLVTVETLDPKDPQGSLKNAIVTTVLAPADPRSLDLYSDKEIKLGDTPFLLGEVKDFDGKDIRWNWRAERFADALMARGITTRTVDGAKGKATAHTVSFRLIKDHLHIRARKYAGLVDQNAAKFKISQNLIYAVIKTESDFNPFAASSAPAFGLMQIVPRSAGAEVSKYLTGKSGKPDKQFLFQPENNILYGTAYLHLLDTRHLNKVTDPISREYCMIAAYNGGSGTVLRSFDKDRTRAVARINALTPKQVYEHLRTRVPFAETRRYLDKVVNSKKLFVGTGRS